MNTNRSNTYHSLALDRDVGSAVVFLKRTTNESCPYLENGNVGVRGGSEESSSRQCPRVRDGWCEYNS